MRAVGDSPVERIVDGNCFNEVAVSAIRSEATQASRTVDRVVKCIPNVMGHSFWKRLQPRGAKSHKSGVYRCLGTTGWSIDDIRLPRKIGPANGKIVE